AAVGMYFTMAVTMPSRVSLGGGGVCVLFRGDQRKSEAIEFLARAAPSGGMVPSGMRAMAALHSRHGALRWEQLLAPAESLARLGHAASRAFAQDLAAAAAYVTAEPTLKRLFTTRDGRLVNTGDKIVQLELSAVLGGIRRQGAPYLHSGPFARRLAEASSAVGMPLTADDVRRNVPRVTEALAVPVGGRYVAYFVPPRATAGVVAAQMWRMAADVGDYEDQDAAGRRHVFAEAALRGFAERARWMRPDGQSRGPLSDLISDARIEGVMADFDPARHTPAARFKPVPSRISDAAYAAGFVIGDQWSNAVACGFTMNRLFGAARVALGTGIILAAPPRAQNDGSTSLAAVVVGNTKTGDIRFAANAGGGAVAATSLAGVMLDTLAREQPLAEAMAAPRVHHGGAPDVLYYEAGLPADVLASLRAQGHELRPSPGLGRVNGIYCPYGLKDAGALCQGEADPRGYGLAQMAQ
ncbi:MAG: gamma-glutamyltransferase, partial [Kiloniellaceae bacterium]